MKTVDQTNNIIETVLVDNGEEIRELTTEELIDYLIETQKDEEVHTEEYKGYTLEVLSCGTLSHYCGYVSGSKEMMLPLFNSYVHGGWTYMNTTVGDDVQVSYLPSESDIPNVEGVVVKLGFDCAHLGDVTPWGIGDIKHIRSSKGDTFKDVGFVLKELKRVIDEERFNADGDC